jgi:hypothetical protein
MKFYDYGVDCGHGYAWVRVMNGTVVDAAPIYNWMVGQEWSKVKEWGKIKKIDLVKVTEADNLVRRQ